MPQVDSHALAVGRVPRVPGTCGTYAIPARVSDLKSVSFVAMFTPRADFNLTSHPLHVPRKTLHTYHHVSATCPCMRHSRTANDSKSPSAYTTSFASSRNIAKHRSIGVLATAHSYSDARFWLSLIEREVLTRRIP